MTMKTRLLILITLTATAGLRASAQTPSATPVIGCYRLSDETQRTNRLSGVTRNFGYDSVERLVSSRVDVNGTPVEQLGYTLDPAGNRVSVTGGVDAGNYTMNAAFPVPADRQVNQYTTTPFDTRTYDRNGNLIAINEGTPTARTFTYDFRNRLVAFTDAAAGTFATYRYDCFGRRFEKVVTTGAGTATRKFSFDGRREIEERDGAGIVQATFVRGANGAVLRSARGGQVYFHHTDGRLNTTAMTNAAGIVVERYNYGDFGEPQFFAPDGQALPASAVGNVWLGGGWMLDAETGFIHRSGRSFESRTGRAINGRGFGAGRGDGFFEIFVGGEARR
jgi:YD repeat-containing protein